MQITVKGCNDPALVEEIKDAINFYADLLMSQRLKQTLTLQLNYIQDPDKEGMRGFQGDVTWEDDNVRPKDYTMNINSKARYKKTILQAIAHEMVHVKQFAKGELKDLLKTKQTRFHDRIYDNDMEYWERPWEIEAFGREYGLYLRFKKYQKDKLKENDE